MPKLYSAREIISVLTRAGFQTISQKGSHIKLRGLRKGKIVTPIIPNHKIVARGTFSSILRQSAMTLEEFESYKK